MEFVLAFSFILAPIALLVRDGAACKRITISGAFALNLFGKFKKPSSETRLPSFLLSQTVSKVVKVPCVGGPSPLQPIICGNTHKPLIINNLEFTGMWAN